MIKYILKQKEFASMYSLRKKKSLNLEFINYFKIQSHKERGRTKEVEP